MIAKAKLWLIVATVAVVSLTVVAVAWRFYLIEGERARAAISAAERFKNTTERIGNADTGTGNADDDLRWLDERLRARSGR